MTEPMSSALGSAARGFFGGLPARFCLPAAAEEVVLDACPPADVPAASCRLGGGWDEGGSEIGRAHV